MVVINVKIVICLISNEYLRLISQKVRQICLNVVFEIRSAIMKCIWEYIHK